MRHRDLVESPALKLRQVRPPRSIHPSQQHLTRFIHANTPGLVDDHRMEYADANPAFAAPPEVSGGFWVGWLLRFHEVTSFRNTVKVEMQWVCEFIILRDDKKDNIDEIARHLLRFNFDSVKAYLVLSFLDCFLHPWCQVSESV